MGTPCIRSLFFLTWLSLEAKTSLPTLLAYRRCPLRSDQILSVSYESHVKVFLTMN